MEVYIVIIAGNIELNGWGFPTMFEDQKGNWSAVSTDLRSIGQIGLENKLSLKPPTI